MSRTTSRISSWSWTTFRSASTLIAALDCNSATRASHGASNETVCTRKICQPCARHWNGARLTLDDMLGLHGACDRGTDVLRKLDEESVDLVERAQRLLAELDGGDLLGDALQRRELKRLLRRTHFGAIVLDVGGELQRGKGSRGQRDGGELEARVAGP